MIIPIQEVFELTKNLRKITSKTEWTGQETGIVLISRAIENYVKNNYELYQEFDFFNFDMSKYTNNYKRIGNQLFKEYTEDGAYLVGYKKINDFLYANFSYTTANKEIIKARYLYFYEKLKLAFGVEQTENFILKEENEKSKDFFYKNMQKLSIITFQDKVKKISESIEDFETALYWLKGYEVLLELIRKIYKLDLLFLMYKEIDIFVESAYQRIKDYNNMLDTFKKYIIENSKENRAKKVEILEKAYKKIVFDYEIPKKKVKLATETMKQPEEKTKESFYCFTNETLLDYVCERSEKEQ